VIGINFNSATLYTCQFGDGSSAATFISSTKLLCTVPPLLTKTSQAVVQILDTSEKPIVNTAGQLSFYYLGTCNDSMCNGQGSCVWGACECNLGWQGPYCQDQVAYVYYTNGQSTEVYLFEGDTFISTPSPFGGNITGYRLLDYPPEYYGQFYFDETTGIITWPSPPFSLAQSQYSDGFPFTVLAYNDVSSVNFTWYGCITCEIISQHGSIQ
jgi:hypothetical protein